MPIQEIPEHFTVTATVLEGMQEVSIRGMRTANPVLFTNAPI